MKAVEIKTCDATEFLNALKRKPKLILTDPPYGMSYQTNIPGDPRWNKSRETSNRFDMLKNDDEIPKLKDMFTAAYACLQNDAFMFVFCNDRAMREWTVTAEQCGFKWKDTLFWNKKCANGGDIKWPFIQVVEMIVCLVKGKPTTNPLYNERYELKQRVVNIFNTGRVKKAEYWGHPTQKPIFICEQIIRATTNEKDLVVDPYCGSGSILVAAQRMGRLYDGCDIDDKYVVMTNARLNGCSIGNVDNKRTEDNTDEPFLD